ncbi:hypothetical protein FPV67DRAFT_1485182 [Lyophyllum atratum]|nr:hypothetical protein FPV67DRAFT_1485182 [Lyophyllum atratum]
MAKALPEDLISPIVANFGDGNPILATCALVCRSWYLPSQALRFRSVELLRYEPCSSLNRLLQSSPHIASFVKSFSFSPTMIAFTRPSVSLRGGGHIGDIDNLLHILSRLTQIQHLEIRGEKTIWHKFPQVLRVSIQTTVQLPSLVSLKLSYWLFFEGGIELQDLLQHFSSLRKLELNRIAVLATPPVPIMPREPIVSSLRLHHRLAWLCIDGCGGLQDWLFASGCVVELKDISQLWLSRLSPIITSRILKSSSSSLQSLGIRVMDPLGDCLDLSQFTNLLYFDFSASVNALTTLAMLVRLPSRPPIR